MTTKYFGSDKSSSSAVIHEGAVYLPAITAKVLSPTVAEQTRQVLDQIDEALKTCGTTKYKMLTATILCPDARAIDEVNTRWDAWVPWHDPPATTFLVVKLPVMGAKVAIQVVAGL